MARLPPQLTQSFCHDPTRSAFINKLLSYISWMPTQTFCDPPPPLDIDDADEWKSMAEPCLWESAIDGMAKDVALIVNEIFKIDRQINELRQSLLAGQPFGSRRIDLRWYLEPRPKRRDPTPVRYVKNSDNNVSRGLPVWAVIRLDRGANAGQALRGYLRTDGPLANRNRWLIPAKVCRQIDDAIKQRVHLVSVVSTLRTRAGTTAAALRRAQAAFHKPL